MPDFLSNFKKAELEKRLATLTEQYKAASTQLRSTLNAADKPAIQEQINQFELEMQQVEAELSQLSVLSGGQRVFIGGTIRDLPDYLPNLVEACQR